MQNYVNTLMPTGNTYHDIGMIWGARMLSAGGIFADSPDTFAACRSSRHIIFMTDGQMDTDLQHLHRLWHRAERPADHRQSHLSETSNGRHLQRFRMICNAAKSLNISIWVIAFGTTLSHRHDQLREQRQPGGDDRGPRRADRASFREIGSNIGALRLTQ